VTGTRGERVRKSAPAGFPCHNLFQNNSATPDPNRVSVSRQRLRPWRNDTRPAAFRVDDSIRLWFADESATTFIRRGSTTGLEPALVPGLGLCSSLPTQRDRAVRSGSNMGSGRPRVAPGLVVGSRHRGGVGTDPGAGPRRLGLSDSTDPQGFGHGRAVPECGRHARSRLRRLTGNVAAGPSRTHRQPDHQPTFAPPLVFLRRLRSVCHWLRQWDSVLSPKLTPAHAPRTTR
jgi:hypothetical protein